MNPIRKRQSIGKSEGKSLQYPKSTEVMSKIFQFKYEYNLSSTAKFILNSFQNKYLYYAIDDILYGLKENLNERNNLLEILYSPILSLHNNFSVNFLDIWIREIYIDEISKPNKFIQDRFQSSKKCNLITIKFFYKTKVPIKRQELLW